VRLQIAVRSLLSDAVHVGKAGGEPVASLSNRRRQFAFGSDRAASEKWHKVGPCTAIRLKSELGQSRHFSRAPMTSGLPRQADILSARRHVSKGRVEDGRGSLGHSATLRFPSPLIEPDVPD